MFLNHDRCICGNSCAAKLWGAVMQTAGSFLDTATKQAKGMMSEKADSVHAASASAVRPARRRNDPALATSISGSPCHKRLKTCTQESALVIEPP